MAQIPLSDEAREARIVQMVRLHEKELLRLCFLYLHDVEPARDMVQETFLRAFAHLDELQDEEKELFWLRKIAINLCRDYLRSGWVRHMNRFVLPEELPLAADPPDESSVLLITAMMNLPPKYSEVLHLRYIQGMEVQEIAETLGLSISAVSRRCKKACHQLRTALEENENE